MITKLIQLAFKDRQGYVGRKLVAAWGVTLLASLLLILHVPVGLLLPGYAIEPVLTNESYQLIIVTVWGTFFASDSVNLWTHTHNTRTHDNEHNSDSGRPGASPDSGGAEDQRDPDNVK